MIGLHEDPGGSTFAGCEPEFLLAVQRAVRAPRDRLAILVHLSRLREARAPLPPPHQLHLARSILQDAAQRFEGQVFSLRNGDLALLCRGAGRPADAPGALAIDPQALPGIMARLFHADMAKLVSVWPLTTHGEALLGYAADRLAETPATPATATLQPRMASRRRWDGLSPRRKPRSTPPWSSRVSARCSPAPGSPS